MEDKAVDPAGITPRQGSFAQIAGLKSKDDLPAVIASLQQGTASDGFLFTFGAAQDLADASRVIADANRGGLGLPDRDYYFRTDAKSKALRTQYVTHIQNMFELLGEPASSAGVDRKSVVEGKGWSVSLNSGGRRLIKKK